MHLELALFTRLSRFLVTIMQQGSALCTRLSQCLRTLMQLGLGALHKAEAADVEADAARARRFARG